LFSDKVGHSFVSETELVQNNDHWRRTKHAFVLLRQKVGEIDSWWMRGVGLFDMLDKGVGMSR